MDQYLKDDEQADLKGMLYKYLKDKAQRRMDATSKATYEGLEDVFKNQMALYDVGALGSAFSKAGQMMGQLNGKQAQSDIVPKLNEQLYGSTQNAFRNYDTLRNIEERSNMNDVNVANLITGIERSDDANKIAKRQMDLSEQKFASDKPMRDMQVQELQQKLKAKRFQPELVGPSGSAVTMDVEGKFDEHPGYKVFHRSPAGAVESWEIMSKAKTPPGTYAVRNKSGKIELREAPTGFEMNEKNPKADKASQEVQYRRNILQQNAEDLKKLVQKYGTFELMGSAGTEMDSKIYQMAVDYAKLVDPDSVAREGEVAAAQKYMLPIRQNQGLTTSNDTAVKLIDDYISNLDKRMTARAEAKGMPQNSGQNMGADMIRVRNKATGKTGKMPKANFDPSKYEAIQ